MHSVAMAQDILRAALTEAEKNNVQSVKAIKIRMHDDRFEPRYDLEMETLQRILL